jgi:DNA (cytosine-5)-methyltransferase 1
MSDLACIDLFCGAGGLTCGLRKAGINVVAGVDVDKSCRYPFEVNNSANFLLEDVGEIKPEQLNEHFGRASVRVLAGCAPCQPFSTYSQRYETVGTARWGLMYHFARHVKSIRPEFVTMENVPTVMKHEVYQDFVKTLQNLGYHVWSEVVDCKKYGLPQNRRRTVLLASRDRPLELISPAAGPVRSVRDAIGVMPSLSQGEKSDADRMHVAASLSNLNLERIRASRPGGTWRDWPKELVAECHRKDTGRTYPGVYGRMSWDQPSPTLTTQFFGFGNGRFGHPDQDRAITLREGAILQGFPPEYSFLPEGDKVHFKTLGRLIGNAVPVTLGKIIGESIKKHLSDHDGLINKSLEDDHRVDRDTGLVA